MDVTRCRTKQCGIACAFDVDRFKVYLRCLKTDQRRTMHDGTDVPMEPLNRGSVEAKAGLCDIAAQNHRP